MPTSTRRRWSQFGLRTIFVGVVVSALVAAFVRYTLRPYPFPDPSKQVDAVEVVLSGAWPTHTLRLTDQSQIDSLVITPLHKSKPLPRGRKAVQLGEMRIEYADGSSDEVFLFLPWGFWSSPDGLRKSDFAMLRELSFRSVKASGKNGARRLNDPFAWQ